MPKTKTSSSAKKRFKVTAGGKLLRRRAMQSHNLTKKSPKRKRRFSKDQPVAGANARALKQMLGRRARRS
ncbi:MAG TPA: 50S ribosomal protein L35 [Gaiellaceae bacterium]|jgi:large subunit ribosomal protein L35|nr:50S ribosomal protein L35 [Gaiellaceae bacterium]